jgi:hypothetical protein
MSAVGWGWSASISAVAGLSYRRHAMAPAFHLKPMKVAAGNTSIRSTMV